MRRWRGPGHCPRRASAPAHRGLAAAQSTGPSVHGAFRRVRHAAAASSRTTSGGEGLWGGGRRGGGSEAGVRCSAALVRPRRRPGPGRPCVFVSPASRPPPATRLCWGGAAGTSQAPTRRSGPQPCAPRSPPSPRPTPEGTPLVGCGQRSGFEAAGRQAGRAGGGRRAGACKLRRRGPSSGVRQTRAAEQPPVTPAPTFFAARMVAMPMDSARRGTLSMPKNADAASVRVTWGRGRRGAAVGTGAPSSPCGAGPVSPPLPAGQ
jgi:hypothetical protein